MQTPFAGAREAAQALSRVKGAQVTTTSVTQVGNATFFSTGTLASPPLRPWVFDHRAWPVSTPWLWHVDPGHVLLRLPCHLLLLRVSSTSPTARLAGVPPNVPVPPRLPPSAHPSRTRRAPVGDIVLAITLIGDAIWAGVIRFY